jgi:hypothetical protein
MSFQTLGAQLCGPGRRGERTRIKNDRKEILRVRRKRSRER